MRVMAAQAFARLCGSVLDFGLVQEVVVTLEAHLFTRRQKQELIRGLVRMMAGGAFARFDRRMFDLCRGDEILVATKANIPHLAFHLLREFRFMALAAFLVEKWLMSENHRLYPRRWFDKRIRSGRCFVRAWIRNNASWRHGRVCRRHAVEKEAQQLVVFGGAASHHDQRSADREGHDHTQF